jgi:urea transport system substrate-binding protein
MLKENSDFEDTNNAMEKKFTLPVTIIVFTIIGVVLGVFVYQYFMQGKSNSSIRVGILHSQTGVMAISELSVIDATMLAIDEINASGGLLGRNIEPILGDGASDWPTFAAQAEKLITKDNVEVVFGCWTSASRKMVKPIFEKYDHLLFYPVQYEGVENSPNIIYTGAVPNQQIFPGVTWAFYNLGKTFFLVGSDYIFPRVANELIKKQVDAIGGTIVGEAYQPLNGAQFKKIVQDIIKAKPQVIISTINGSSNITFFKELRSAGITPDKIPTVSFSIAEEEFKVLSVKDFVGDYAAWNYFQSIDSPENKKFVQAFKKRYGESRVMSDPLEAAYFGVYLWAQAVKNAGTAKVRLVKEKLKVQGMDAPEGVVYIDANNNHTWKIVRIGKILENGQFKQVWSSIKAICPIPFPFEGKQDWSWLLDRLYKGWGNQWSAQ